jgi:hypothetical protein
MGLTLLEPQIAVARPFGKGFGMWMGFAAIRQSSHEIVRNRAAIPGRTLVAYFLY